MISKRISSPLPGLRSFHFFDQFEEIADLFLESHSARLTIAFGFSARSSPSRLLLTASAREQTAPGESTLALMRSTSA